MFKMSRLNGLTPNELITFMTLNGVGLKLKGHPVPYREHRWRVASSDFSRDRGMLTRFADLNPTLEIYASLYTLGEFLLGKEKEESLDISSLAVLDVADYKLMPSRYNTLRMRTTTDAIRYFFRLTQDQLKLKPRFRRFASLSRDGDYRLIGGTFRKRPPTVLIAKWPVDSRYPGWADAPIASLPDEIFQECLVQNEADDDPSTAVVLDDNIISNLYTVPPFITKDLVVAIESIRRSGQAATLYVAGPMLCGKTYAMKHLSQQEHVLIVNPALQTVAGLRAQLILDLDPAVRVLVFDDMKQDDYDKFKEFHRAAEIVVFIGGEEDIVFY